MRCFQIRSEQAANEAALTAILNKHGLREVHNLSDSSSEFDTIRFAPRLDDFIFEFSDKLTKLEA